MANGIELAEGGAGVLCVYSQALMTSAGSAGAWAQRLLVLGPSVWVPPQLLNKCHQEERPP